MKQIQIKLTEYARQLLWDYDVNHQIIEEMLGDKISPHTPKTISINLTDNQYARLVQKKIATGRTIQYLVNEAIINFANERHVTKHKQSGTPKTLAIYLDRVLAMYPEITNAQTLYKTLIRIYPHEMYYPKWEHIVIVTDRKSELSLKIVDMFMTMDIDMGRYYYVPMSVSEWNSYRKQPMKIKTIGEPRQ